MNYPKLLLLLSVLLCACHKEPATPESLHGRLQAASAILDVGARDTALAKVATDAAEARNSEVASRALDSILSVQIKDEAAETCALSLSKQADAQGAAAIAQKVLSIQIRDRTLRAIAAGR